MDGFPNLWCRWVKQPSSLERFHFQLTSPTNDDYDDDYDDGDDDYDDDDYDNDVDWLQYFATVLKWDNIRDKEMFDVCSRQRFMMMIWMDENDVDKKSWQR